jgi:hypothetical protein
MNNLVAINYYLFDSCLGNKYIDYRLKIFSKYSYIDMQATNDDSWRIAA